MTLEIGLVFGILAIAVVLFVTELVRVDVVALMVMVSLGLTGLISPTDAISGFSNPAVITVWAVFILSGGLARTGIAGILGRQVLRLAGNSEPRLIVIIMVTAATLSAFMNNVGVAAMLLPVVMDISRRTRRPPSKLLIPLAFSSLLGGLMTLIGTPPNILVSAAMAENGLEPFAMFDFTPVGAAVVAAGILYMALLGRSILPARNAAREMAGEETDLDQLYSLRARLFVLDVPEGSPLAGKSLAECRIGAALGLNVMGIRRGGRLDLAPDPTIRFEVGDQVVVQGQQDALGEVGVPQYLTLQPTRVSTSDLVSEEIGFAEVVLQHRSRLVGQTPRDIDFRNRFGVLIVAMWRDGRPHMTHLASTQLGTEDVLLAHGPRESLEAMREDANFEVREVGDLERYRLGERLMSLEVPAGSPAIGKTLAESRLGDVFSLGVLAIIRKGQKQLMPHPTTRLDAGDTLLVRGQREDLETVEGLHELLVRSQGAVELSDIESERIGLAEAVLSPRSTVAGKTLPELHFREKYGFNVVAVMREGEIFRNLRYFPLRFGDALLLHGPREKLKVLGSEPDFLVLTEEAQEPPLTAKAPLAAALMAAVVGSVILGWLPIYIAAVTGATLMVLTGCLTMNEAYRNIEWRAVFLIAGMLPLGLALQQTGAAELVAGLIVDWTGGLGPLVVVAGFYVLTALAAQVMPTAAVAILMAPLAITSAIDLGISPYALMMTVALSASASFMSPVAHPANVLIMGPGGYRFIDYIKVGLPLTLVCLVVVLVVLPLVWPLSP
jgi:di/tricarboxylate transporter